MSWAYHILYMRISGVASSKRPRGPGVEQEPLLPMSGFCPLAIGQHTYARNIQVYALSASHSTIFCGISSGPYAQIHSGPLLSPSFSSAAALHLLGYGEGGGGSEGVG